MHYLMFAVVMVKALSNLFNAVSIKVRNDTKKKKKKSKQMKFSLKNFLQLSTFCLHSGKHALHCCGRNA